MSANSHTGLIYPMVVGAIGSMLPGIVVGERAMSSKWTRKNRQRPSIRKYSMKPGD